VGDIRIQIHRRDGTKLLVETGERDATRGADGGIVKTYFRSDWNEFMRAAQHVLIFGQFYTNNN